MAKPHVTRTLGPIHFEDLDPHRFEDLVRQLAYDFRQWKSIESTGRGGADDGFDVRAYEEARMPQPSGDEDSEPDEIPHPMDGNLWMVQCKREREVGPKKLSAIIAAGVDPETPPYGYILAAPVAFSKVAHDRFREELRKRHVMEFYLWGAGELEDMLYQPKNDHILFAFFGISLSTRRRSRTSHVRSAVTAKNKLMRLLGENPQHESVLVRDLNDEHYPYEDRCPDFAKHPPWRPHSVVAFHPLGLALSINRHFAYLEARKKEWDFTKVGDTARAHVGNQLLRDAGRETEILRVRGFWEQLPRANRATFVRNGLIRFDEIQYVDDKGDTEYPCVHIFVDALGTRSPFSGFNEYLEVNEHHHVRLDGLTRTTIFPSSFSDPTFGKIHSDVLIAIPQGMRAALRHGSGELTLYDLDGRYDNLAPTDVVPVDVPGERGTEKKFLKVTSAKAVMGKDLMAEYPFDLALRTNVEQQVGRELLETDQVRVVEAVTIYDWQIEQNRPVI